MIIITGQTATGKTKIALEYAQKYNGELINFDSRQIYQYLDIITGKDLPNNSKFKSQKLKLKIKKKNFIPGYYLISTSFNNLQLFSTKIWLYDIVKPNQYFSSYEYVKIAQKVIKDIINRSKTPILVGGSYFYLKHLLYGFDYKVPPNFKLRQQLNKKSVEELQKILKSLNEKTLKQMNHSDQNNPRRLIRKIEILKKQNLTGSIFKNNLPKFLISKFIGLRYKNKNQLRQAITNRVENRLKTGAIDEVKNLLKMGYKKTDPGLKTIGYQQIINYLENKIPLNEAINQWITAEIQYAKRQYAFMKKDPHIEWKEI